MLSSPFPFPTYVFFLNMMYPDIIMICAARPVLERLEGWRQHEPAVHGERDFGL